MKKRTGFLSIKLIASFKLNSRVLAVMLLWHFLTSPEANRKRWWECSEGKLQWRNKLNEISKKIQQPHFLKATWSVLPTYLVKTPAASPKVVSLALSRTSASVSNDKMDITGPKISSFTQVMSSRQLAANIILKTKHQWRNYHSGMESSFWHSLFIVNNEIQSFREISMQHF